MSSPGSLEVHGDQGVWTYRNDGTARVAVVFEPRGDEILVEPGSTLTISTWGGRQPPDGVPPLLVIPERGGVTVWCQWPESYGAAYLDGVEV